MPQNSIELLQKLMEKYSRVFMSFAGKQGVPYDDVEDIVMASFWSCYKGGYLEKMTEPEIKKVLVRIVYNKCMDYHRKAAPTDIAAIEDCETELDKISYRAGNAVDKTVVSNENCQYIRDTIDGLKDIWREPVRMYFIEERSIPEISRALGITEEVCPFQDFKSQKVFKRKAEGAVGTVPVASAALLDGLDQFHNSMNGIVQVAFFHGLYELTPVFVGIRDGV